MTEDKRDTPGAPPPSFVSDLARPDRDGSFGIAVLPPMPFEGMVNAYEHERRDLWAKLQAAIKENAELVNERDRWIREAERWQAECVRTQASLEELRAENVKLKILVEEVQAENAKLRKQVDSLQDRVGALERTVAQFSNNLGARQYASNIEARAIKFVWPGALGRPFYLRTWRFLRHFLSEMRKNVEPDIEQDYCAHQRDAYFGLPEKTRTEIDAKVDVVMKTFPSFSLAVKTVKQHGDDHAHRMQSFQDLLDFFQTEHPDDIDLLVVLSDVDKYLKQTTTK